MQGSASVSPRRTRPMMTHTLLIHRKRKCMTNTQKQKHFPCIIGVGTPTHTHTHTHPHTCVHLLVENIQLAHIQDDIRFKAHPTHACTHTHSETHTASLLRCRKTCRHSEVCDGCALPPLPFLLRSRSASPACLVCVCEVPVHEKGRGMQ